MAREIQRDGVNDSEKSLYLGAASVPLVLVFVYEFMSGECTALRQLEEQPTNGMTLVEQNRSDNFRIVR